MTNMYLFTYFFHDFIKKGFNANNCVTTSNFYLVPVLVSARLEHNYIWKAKRQEFPSHFTGGIYQLSDCSDLHLA